jgi:RNA polymerase sigma factor (sigma-70 family)
VSKVSEVRIPGRRKALAMAPLNPLNDAAETDPDDVQLVRRIRDGDRDALEALVIRHQDWIYNIVLRMVYHPQDAQDATQEVLLKLLTKLSTFEGRSSFRAWLYRIVVNQVLNMKRARGEAAEWDFATYGRGLDSAPDADLPDPRSVPVDVQLVVDEARIGCSSGMLLCLDREQRLVYILGEIFGVSDAIGSELLDISRDNFRQKLSRRGGISTGSCTISVDWSTRPIHAAANGRPRHGRRLRRSGQPAVRQDARDARARRVGESARGHRRHRPRLRRDSPRSSVSPVAGLRARAAGSHRTAEIPIHSGFVVAIGDEELMQMDGFDPEGIITMERAALDRWGKGDPQGYLEILAQEVTYFDPIQRKRVDGLPPMTALLVPFTAKIKIDRYEMIDPAVQRHGHLAILTFNLVNYRRQADTSEQPVVRWIRLRRTPESTGDGGSFTATGRTSRRS